MSHAEALEMRRGRAPRRREGADRPRAALLGRLHGDARAAAHAGRRRADGGGASATIRSFRSAACTTARWRKDRRFTAGGTLIEHGVHDLDLLTWFFGPIARLRAWQQNRAGHPGIEDYVAVELEFACGLRAQLVNLWHDMVQRPSNRRLEIFCQRGFFASDHDMVGDIAMQLGDGARAAARQRRRARALRRPARPRPTHASATGTRCPICCRISPSSRRCSPDREPAPGLEVGVEAQRIAEAVYRAADSGEEVEVAEASCEGDLGAVAAAGRRRSTSTCGD